jgi:DNA repair protein RadC
MYNIPLVKLSYVNEFTGLTPEKIVSSRQAYQYLLSLYEPGQLAHIERFFILLLNRNNRILGAHLVSVGGVAGTVVDPKIIFQSALLANASGIILCHNHPSGSLTPSQPDLQITRKLKNAGNFFDIIVSDHIIISPAGCYYSFADEGLM